MNDAVATLEIRDADQLNEVEALALGRKVATSLGTKIIRHGPARAELHISRRARKDMDSVCEWLEDQGIKLLLDRREYAGIYKAKLYQ